MSRASERIRQLNDTFRTAGPTQVGWLVTSGVQSLGPTALSEIIREVMAFSSFTPDNDPYGEHDFGLFRFAGEMIYWKIDYYDLDLTYGSPDPANPDVTRRVLTILLASEY